MHVFLHFAIDVQCCRTKGCPFVPVLCFNKLIIDWQVQVSTT